MTNDDVDDVPCVDVVDDASNWMDFAWASCRAVKRCRIDVRVDCELVRALVLITFDDLTVQPQQHV